MARTLRRERAAFAPGIDRTVAYLAQGSTRSAALAVLAGTHERVGFATSPARAMYTRRVPYIENQHHAARLWQLAFPHESRSQPRAERLRPHLYPGPAENAAVSDLLREHGVKGPFVALAPGSVWGTKRWPYYAELSKRITMRDPIAIGGGRDDHRGGDLQGPGRAEEAVTGARGADPQHAVLVGDGGLLGRLDVAALARVGGPDLDGAVGSVGGDDLDAPGGDVQGDGDRGGGGELLHGVLPALSLFPTARTLRCICKVGNYLVANKFSNSR
jgi:heptosyltransferase-2